MDEFDSIVVSEGAGVMGANWVTGELHEEYGNGEMVKLGGHKPG